MTVSRPDKWLVVLGMSIDGETSGAVDPDLAGRSVVAMLTRKTPAVPAQAGPDDREAA